RQPRCLLCRFLGMRPVRRAPGEPAALATKVQEYVQQATEVARSVLATVQESEAAQQARKWLADNAALARQQLPLGALAERRQRHPRTPRSKAPAAARLWQ
uniref:Apolipoprotein C-III n=1 Tax=Apteryx owenii TaxID=8824 RepID=A0A8B9PR46_APTOW